MPAQNLQTYEITCPCGGRRFAQSVIMDLGPNGLIEKKGGWVCLECQKTLALDQAVRQAEMTRKRHDLRLMEEEIESMSA